MIFIIVNNPVCLLTFTHILLHCSALFSKFELTYVYINSYPIYSVCPISIIPLARIYFGMIFWHVLSSHMYSKHYYLDCGWMVWIQVCLHLHTSSRSSLDKDSIRPEDWKREITVKQSMQCLLRPCYAFAIFASFIMVIFTISSAYRV